MIIQSSCITDTVIALVSISVKRYELHVTTRFTSLPWGKVL